MNSFVVGMFTFSLWITIKVSRFPRNHRTSDSCPADGNAGGWNQQAVHRSQRVPGVQYNNKTDMGGDAVPDRTSSR